MTGMRSGAVLRRLIRPATRSGYWPTNTAVDVGTRGVRGLIGARIAASLGRKNLQWKL